MEKLDEKILIFRLRVGKDPEAFGKLYDKYVSRIYRFIYFKVPTQEEAQDLTSEAFLKPWQHISEGKAVRTLGPLIFQIARNLVVDFYRSRSRTPPQVSAEDIADIVDEKSLARLQLQGDLQTLRSALQHLKDEYREALVLRYIEGLSPGEISGIIGKSGVATRVLLHRALQTLKGIVEGGVGK